VATAPTGILRRHRNPLGRVHHRNGDVGGGEMVLKSRPFRIWYVILMGFIAILGGFTLTIWFIGYQGAQTRADVCEVIQSQLAVFNESPPSTPTGIKARESWVRLNDHMKCDKAVKHD
jgi:hypothetical protein